MNIANFADVDPGAGRTFSMRDLAACCLPIVLLAASIVSLL